MAAAIVALACPAAAGAVQLVKVGDFVAPIYVTAPPGDPDRLFVVEQGGVVKVRHEGVWSSFLDVHADAVTTDERGLFSIAFAPDYATSGRLYAMYTAPRTGDPNGDVVTVAEYRRSPSNPDRADPATRRIVLTVDHPAFPDHNGGQIQFGPDGLLYVSIGDGGFPRNSQSTGTLLGKILRIDPRPHRGAPFRVPAGNPFARAPGADQIWAYGLRNPWRFSFDRLTGAVAIGDVGQDTREEIDFAPRGTGAGADYGWRCMEGSMPNPNPKVACTPSGRYVAPVFDYRHADDRCAIVGGYVVRNHDLDSNWGRYVYADFCSADIRSILLGRPAASQDRSTGVGQASIKSFGEDSCGHLYVAFAAEVDVLLDGPFTPCDTDRIPPRLTVSRPRVQHLQGQRSLRMSVSCDELCELTVSAKLTVPGAGRTFTLERVSRSLQPDRATELSLGLSRRAARAAETSARNGHRVRAAIVAVVLDQGGNRSVRRADVRIEP